MMNHLEKHRSMLEVLQKASPKLRKAILQNSNDELICVLAELIVNFMEGHVTISKQQKQKLKPYRKMFRNVVNNCSNHKLKNKKKIRKTIVQSGGFLPLLLPLIAKAALGGLVSTGVGLAAKKIIG